MLTWHTHRIIKDQITVIDHEQKRVALVAWRQDPTLRPFDEISWGHPGWSYPKVMKWVQDGTWPETACPYPNMVNVGLVEVRR